MPKSKDTDAKIKIIEVISDSILGGGPRHVLGLLKNINKEKFDVLLIAPRGWLMTEAVKIKAVKVKIVEFKSKWDLSSLSKLKKNIAEFRTGDNPFGSIIVHAHGPRAGYFCRLAVRSGERFIYTEHLWNEDLQLKNRLNGFFQLAGLKSICKKANLVIAVSKSVEKFIVERLKIKDDKIVIIPNAIEIDGNYEHLSHPQKLLVGSIGSLNKQKGQIYLIQAFERVAASLPKARLEIVGDGPEKEKLQAEVNHLGLQSRIQLLGRQEKPEKFLKSWDLFVLPSLSETFGLSILEAFMAKVPVVASNVGGIPELVHDGRTGYLVPPANPEKLSKAISYLLAERQEREKLARAAYQSLKEHYDWSKIIKIIEDEYRKLSR